MVHASFTKVPKRYLVSFVLVSVQFQFFCDLLIKRVICLFFFHLKVFYRKLLIFLFFHFIFLGRFLIVIGTMIIVDKSIFNDFSNY